MAGAFTLISKIDDREIVKALGRLHARADRLAPALKNIGEELLRSTQERFEDQADPDGRPWQELADSTLRAKMLKGVGRGKGQSRKSLTTQRGNTRAGAIRALVESRILWERGYLAKGIRYQASDRSLRVGTNRIYGAVHQFGGKAGRGHRVSLPARPFLGISRSDRERILEVLSDHLRRKG